jgi:hypothetical protein
VDEHARRFEPAERDGLLNPEDNVVSRSVLVVPEVVV